MGSKHRDLVQHCVSLLNTYDPSSLAEEEHVAQYIAYQQGVEEADIDFITEVFMGCTKYAGVLTVVTSGFYNRDGLRVLQSEENLYKVFTYLAFFRLDELGLAHYRRFVYAQDLNKMFKFLNFIFDDRKLRTWMKDEWCRIYENTFVQTTLLSPIGRWLPELQEMVKQMSNKIAHKAKGKKIQTKPTETKPFNITKPRPRSVPMPEPIPKLQKHNPVPNTLYHEPKEIDFLDRMRSENRRKAEERLMEASKIQFACANPEKSDKTKGRMQAIISTEEEKLDFNKSKAHRLPSQMLRDNIPIKLNAAAILREGNLYRKREVEELKRLEKLEAGHKDGSEFQEWQDKMKKKDLDGQLADIERRRLEGKLSYEDAILARQDLIKENREKVVKMKQEANKLMQEYLERRMQEEQDMKKLVEQVVDTHENAKDAKKKLQEYKAKIVQEVNQESKELMRQALEEAELEMKQRMELIKQIRAMEAVPVIRTKLVDLSESAGYGFLGEMSVAELKERISFLKINTKNEEEEKRDQILAGKEAKDQKLMDTLETISRHRVEHNKASAVNLERRKKTHSAKPEVKDEKVLELQRRLEERRMERKKEQEQRKLVPSKKSSQRMHQLHQDKKALEEHRWAELEHTKEKAAKLSSANLAPSARAARIANTRTMLYT